MLDILNLDSKTKDLLQGIKDSYLDKDQIAVFYDWLEENGELDLIQYFKHKKYKLYIKHGGRWLGSLWQRASQVHLMFCLIWNVDLTTYSQDEIQIMAPWLGSVNLDQSDSAKIKVDLSLFSFWATPYKRSNLYALLDLNIKAKILQISYNSFSNADLIKFLDKCTMFEYVSCHNNIEHPKRIPAFFLLMKNQ